ncbi:MAG: alpha/beta fold hydrolase [Proteobacteria bacterium]|nr:alpha/beta fold hydrolase [Pseudomonadota bacterium]
MPVAHVNGIDIYWESMGHGEPMLLIMGLGAQLVTWDDEFCARLAGRGFRVIRFDNRDVGLSSRLDHLRVASMRQLLLRAALGRPVRAPYSLRDMAADAVGLLDALDIARAHIVGASMGGMIAQIMAIEHPGRVRSLTSIMSHPGDPLSKLARPRALRAFTLPYPRTREEAIANYVATFRAIGSRGFAVDEDRLRRRAALAYDRSFYPRGLRRQFAAIAEAQSRVQALRSVRAPTMVLHGADDPLVPPRGGRATARAIPGARLRMIDGMGHDMPPDAWPLILDAIANVAR